jgi:phosphomannomutase
MSVVHLNGDARRAVSSRAEPTEKNLTGLARGGPAAARRRRLRAGPRCRPPPIVDENGKYIGEEYSLALCAKLILSKRPGPVVSNLSTSRMIDDIAAQHGGRVVRTPSARRTSSTR